MKNCITTAKIENEGYKIFLKIHPENLWLETASHEQRPSQLHQQKTQKA